jgi:hypothetical protein
VVGVRNRPCLDRRTPVRPPGNRLLRVERLPVEQPSLSPKKVDRHQNPQQRLGGRRMVGNLCTVNTHGPLAARRTQLWRLTYEVIVDVRLNRGPQIGPIAGWARQKARYASRLGKVIANLAAAGPSTGSIPPAGTGSSGRPVGRPPSRSTSRDTRSGCHAASDVATKPPIERPRRPPGHSSRRRAARAGRQRGRRNRTFPEGEHFDRALEGQGR